MSLAKLELTEESKLVFDVKVSGTDESVSDYRFVIEHEKFNIVCKGTIVEDGIEVTIPKLKGILTEGVYSTSLEIIINDKVFVPLHEAIELLPNIELSVESKTLDNDKKDVVKIEVSGSTVKSSIQEAKELGYTIVNSQEKTILKNEEGYCGYINEDNEMLFIDEPQDFLSHFFDKIGTAKARA